MLNTTGPMPLDVTLAVLAGGAGVRMGQPKGLLKIHGQPVLARLLDQLNWRGPTLLVMSPGREIPRAAERFNSIAWDAAPDEGPLRGALTAVENASTSIVLVIPVDMPGLTSEPLTWLAEKLAAQPDLAAMMTSRVVAPHEEPKLEPMPIALRRGNIAPLLVQRLEARRRSLHGLADDSRIGVIPSPAHWPNCFWRNLNEPGDLQKFLSETANTNSYDSIVSEVHHETPN